MSTKQPDALRLADELAFTGVIECVLASEHIRRLYAANVELAGALKAMLAEKKPFAPIDQGGMGLEYTSENVVTSAWKSRAEHAVGLAESALAKHGGQS